MPTTEKAKKKKKAKPAIAEWELRDAVEWTPDIKFGSHVIIDHKSYTKWVRKEFDYLPQLKVTGGRSEALKGKEGEHYATFNNFTFIWRNLPTHHYVFSMFYGSRWARSWLSIVQGVYPHQKEGQACFTGDVPVPLLLGDRPMSDREDVWMSTTPMEIISQRAGIRKARGKVLVGGLGLGWFAKRCCERKQVAKVTVVEREKALIDTIGAALKKRYGDKIDFIHGDAYDALEDGAEHKYTAVLYDIWPGYGSAQDDRRFKKWLDSLDKVWPSIWAWGYGRIEI